MVPCPPPAGPTGTPTTRIACGSWWPRLSTGLPWSSKGSKPKATTWVFTWSLVKQLHFTLLSVLNVSLRVRLPLPGVQIRLRGGAQRAELRLKAARQVLRLRETRCHRLPPKPHEDRVQVGQHRVQEGLQGSLLLW